MLCGVCNIKEASIDLTELANGTMKKWKLCEICAKEKVTEDPTGFAIDQLLLGLATYQKPQEIQTIEEELICPVCRFSQTEFKKTGRLGCGVCYDTFSEGLTPMLQNMHPNIVHIGKVPAKFSSLRIKELQRKKLQKMLQKAISEEQYETAALLHSEILTLETPSS